MEYKYMVFEILKNKTDDADSNLKETIKVLLTQFNCLSFIFPTHDGKIYAVFRDDPSLNNLNTCLKNNNGILSNSNIELKHVHIENNGFSEYGFFGVKSDFFSKSNSFESRRQEINKRFALDLTILFDKNTQKEYELLTLQNSYQYELLNHFYRSKFQTESFTPNNSNSTTAVNNLKANNSFEILNNSNYKLVFRDTRKNVKFTIKYGDLLDEKVNVIVNAANERLQLGGGIAGAIETKCGRQVQKDCDEILKKLGVEKIEVSQVVATRAYNIHASQIIHACGPRWSDYKPNEKKECWNDLKNTFFNVLIYAETILKNIESIGIPLISSNIFGVPKLICCEALYEAINEYLNESNDAKRMIKSVVLINKDYETNKELFDYFLKRLKLDENLNKREIVSPSKKITNKCVECEASDNLSKINCGCYYCNDCSENMEQNEMKCGKCES